MAQPGANLGFGAAGIAPAEDALRVALRFAIATLILAAIWITTKPFIGVTLTDGVPQGGDIVNQITFAGLAALAAGMMAMTCRDALRPLLQPSYIFLITWLVFAVASSTAFEISMRAFQFAIVILFLAAATLVLPKNERHFSTMLMLCAGSALTLSYLGVIALPDLAKHTDFDPFEPEHAGSWRGHFDHKNIAGAMMGVFMFAGFYLVRKGRGQAGYPILFGAFLFLAFTGSKTSLALAPAVIIFVLMAERVRFAAARLPLLLAPVLIMLTATLGSVLFKPVNAIVQWIAPETTFTGRVDIWKFGFEKFVERPLTGYGFEAFWLTPTTLRSESKQELAWSVDKIVHGHNSYLDAALTLGLPGLVLALYIFLLKPLIDYNRASTDPAERPLAGFFLMIWLFIALGMCVESYLFRRSDPVWFSLLMAVFGLRFLAARGLARK
jgi:O-antigen ligase